MYEDLEAKASEARNRAERFLHDRVQSSQQRVQEHVNKLSNVVIVDKLIDPKVMSFWGGADNKLLYSYSGAEGALSIHKHARSQMAETSGVDRRYATRLAEGKDWEVQLLAHNLQERFHKGEYVDRKKNPAKFLVRQVGREVRGFLSRSYNRKLVTMPLLKTFLTATMAHQAAPVEVIASDIRCWVKCMLPVVFEPIPGEFIAFGATFSNSDYGMGKLTVSGTVMRLSTGTSAILSDDFSKRHIGTLIEEGDLEMSETTAELELAAVRSAMTDNIKGVLSPASIQKTLDAIEAAHDQGITWTTLKDHMSQLLSKADLARLKETIYADVVELPGVYAAKNEPVVTIEPLPSVWKAMKAVEKIAEDELNPEKKAGIEMAAGALLKL